MERIKILAELVLLYIKKLKTNLAREGEQGWTQQCLVATVILQRMGTRLSNICSTAWLQILCIRLCEKYTSTWEENPLCNTVLPLATRIQSDRVNPARFSHELLLNCWARILQAEKISKYFWEFNSNLPDYEQAFTSVKQHTIFSAVSTWY